MNKLIIVGNGFDLAHNLPTSYKHFINDFWSNLENTCSQDIIADILNINPNFNGYFRYEDKTPTCYSDFLVNIRGYSKEKGLKISEGGKPLLVRSRPNINVFSF